MSTTGLGLGFGLGGLPSHIYHIKKEEAMGDSEMMQLFELRSEPHWFQPDQPVYMQLAFLTLVRFVHTTLSIIMLRVEGSRN